MRAAIFDFDGVIVDSEPLHFRALRESLLPEGIAINEEEYNRLYLAYDDRGAIRLALEHHGVPSSRPRGPASPARKAADLRGGAPDVPFFPGVRELSRALAAEMPVAIASGALRAEIEAILTAARAARRVRASSAPTT